MIVADVSFIDFFWSILWFYFLLIWLMILFHILSDLFRDHSLSGVAKTLWVLFLVFLPFLGAIVYMITRGKGHSRAGRCPPAAVRRQCSQRRRPERGDTRRPDRPGQGAAGRGHDRPGRVRPPESQSARLSTAPDPPLEWVR